MKKCNICGIEKTEDCFHRHSTSKDRLQSCCKDCRKERDSKRNWSLFDRRRKYGLSNEDINKLFDAQDNKCAICKSELKPSKATHIDHCHDTNIVRGILCHNCNVGLGHFRDDVYLLNAAIQYLNKPRDLNG